MEKLNSRQAMSVHCVFLHENAKSEINTEKYLKVGWAG